MKLYTIEVCACGRITYHDVDCPTEWLGSGVYDVEYEVHEVYDTDYDDDEVEYDERFPIPDCYSEELPSLTLQEKLDIILSNWDREARSNVRFYKDKDDETSKRVLARSEYWLDFIDKLRRELKK